MASIIEKKGLDRWVLALFEAHKTTREIEAIINAHLEKNGQAPISQPTFARFLKPYRDARNEEKRNIINTSFNSDLEQLNLLINRNFAIANGLDWDEKRQVPRVRPDGSYRLRTYKISEQIAASKVAIGAIMKKFDHLRPEERQVYAEVASPGGEPLASERSRLSDSELNERISKLLSNMNMGDCINAEQFSADS